MKTMGMREARASSDALEKALAEAGEIVLTNHGKPFARVLPYFTPQTKSNAAGAKPRVGRSHSALRALMPFQAVGSETLLRAERDLR